MSSLPGRSGYRLLCWLGLMSGLLPLACPARTPLPPVEAPPLVWTQTPARVLLKRIEVRGATVLGAEDFERAARPWLGQLVGTLELAGLVQALSQTYQAAGFEGSTVVLADQAIADGTIAFEAREAVLAEVDVPGTPRWIRAAHVRRSFHSLIGRPLHVPSLRSLMIQLRESGLYDRLDAEVQLPPGSERAARLVIVADPSFPMQFEFSSANNRNPSIGTRRDEIGLRHASLTGHGDLLDLRAGRTAGLDDWQVRYEMPLPHLRLRVHAQATRSSSIAIEPAIFRALDIRSTADSDQLGAQFALRDSAEEKWLVLLQGEQRTSLTTLLGVPFSFTPGLADAEARSRAVRLESQWSRRQADRGWAARLAFIQGKVDDVQTVPSGLGITPRYRILQAGVEGAWRPQALPGEWRLRFDLQHTRDTLIAADRLSLGGAGSVRGFRENTSLRDRGVFGSVEWRPSPWVWRESISLTPGVFIDYGASRNVRSTDDGAPRRLSSAGVILEAAWRDRVQLKFHWAHASDKVRAPDPSLQDRGVHLALRVALR